MTMIINRRIQINSAGSGDPANEASKTISTTRRTQCATEEKVNCLFRGRNTMSETVEKELCPFVFEVCFFSQQQQQHQDRR